MNMSPAHLHWRPINQQNFGPNSPAVNQFNNQSFNEALLNVKETILCVVFASVTTSIFLLITQMNFDSKFAERKMVILSFHDKL